MRRLVISSIALALVGLTVRGQEAVGIKLAYPEAGQRVKTTIDERANQMTGFTVAGTPQSMEDVKGKALVYTDEVIENPKNEARATKLKRTFEKALITTNGKTSALGVEGKTILIEKVGDKYKFTVDGKPLPADSEKLLNDEFNKGDQKDPRQVMLPQKPVKPGDTWKVDVADLMKMMGPEGPQLDKDKTTASGKLVKTYQQDGKQFGVLEFTVDAPITGLGPKGGFVVKDGKMIVTMTADGCIDGTSPSGKTVSGIKFNVAGVTNGIDVKVEVDLRETRTMELLTKK
jgi:hypothetical protein